jgi:branched-chain amino acid transport system permease protein
MQVLVNGLLTGATIAVLALAFQLVYLPTKIFHIAQGAVYTVVPLVVWECKQSGIPWGAAVTIGLVTGMLFSALIDLVNHGPLDRRGAGYVAHLLSSLGVYIVTIQVVVIVWGNETKMLWSTTGIVRLGDVIVPMSHAISGLVSVGVLVLFALWLRFSKIGLTFRALADNPKEVALRGYNVRLLRLIAFVVSGLLTGVAAILEAQAIGFYPFGGLSALMVAVTAAIIGGRTSLVGPVIAGFLIGIVRAQVIWRFSAEWQDGVTFVLLMICLIVRPQGFISRRGRIEAAA